MIAAEVNAGDVASARQVGPRKWESLHRDRCPHGRFISTRWRVTVDHDGPPTGEEWSGANIADLQDSLALFRSGKVDDAAARFDAAWDHLAASCRSVIVDAG